MAAGVPTRAMTPELSKPAQLPTPPETPAPPEALPGAGRARRPIIGHRAPLRALPIAGAPPPTAIMCLKCQLLGRPRLTCSKADVCAELPRTFAVGPILLAAWLATAIAFVVAVYGR